MDLKDMILVMENYKGNNNYTKEEVLSGFKQLLSACSLTKKHR